MDGENRAAAGNASGCGTQAETSSHELGQARPVIRRGYELSRPIPAIVVFDSCQGLDADAISRGEEISRLCYSTFLLGDR